MIKLKIVDKDNCSKSNKSEHENYKKIKKNKSS